jgi:hypothetical protein
MLSVNPNGSPGRRAVVNNTESSIRDQALPVSDKAATKRLKAHWRDRLEQLVATPRTEKSVEVPFSEQAVEKNGGDDGTRTRGLCRDRAAF